ncbi:hypothetical protein CLB_3190 [Clostridium botulinum A str. ATCC 19397]|nr:hypothetical protein CLB_3190 [Clostridium botulinum A str. ATCC 19397]
MKLNLVNYYGDLIKYIGSKIVKNIKGKEKLWFINIPIT